MYRVKKLSKVRTCARLPRNLLGRDFVVGDLHGHRALLESELDRLGFDPGADRLFSVGDLIDRGPDSLGTLALLEQPWFHAVLGNHELMLLNWLGLHDSRLHSRRAFESGGGRWVLEAAMRHRKTLRRLADRVAALPLALHVDAEVPFNVMHGDLHPLRFGQAELLSKRSVCVHEADRATSSRANLAGAACDALPGLRFDAHRVRLSDRPLGTLELTYVGHSPVRDVTVHNSYVYIDQGVCASAAGSERRAPPTVLAHPEFATWLGGVATALGAVAVPGTGPRPVLATYRPAASAVALETA
jgi:serine/threonine protein phosphatase 1